MFNHQHHQKALTSKDIKTQPKIANIAGLQLADLLAHPVKQACLAERGFVPSPVGVFGTDIAVAAGKKFNINEWRRDVSGYGKVWL